MNSAAALHPCGVADADRYVLQLFWVSQAALPHANPDPHPKTHPYSHSDPNLPSSAFDKRVKADTDGFFAGVGRRVRLDPADPLPPRLRI